MHVSGRLRGRQCGSLNILSKPLSEQMSLHICLGVSGPEFQRKLQGSPVGSKEHLRRKTLAGLWRARGGTFCKVQSELIIPPLPSHPLGVTGRQMIDKQMNRHPDGYIDLAIFSSSSFLNLYYETDSGAKNLGRYVRVWGSGDLYLLSTLCI